MESIKNAFAKLTNSVSNIITPKEPSGQQVLTQSTIQGGKKRKKKTKRNKSKKSKKNYKTRANKKK